MSLNFENKYGTVKIKENVVAYIAGMAVRECDKVLGNAVKNNKDLKPDKFLKGIKIKTDGGVLNIEVHIIVEYGTKITEAAEFIIGRVKYRIEEFTGFKVNDVNIFVEGVNAAL